MLMLAFKIPFYDMFSFLFFKKYDHNNYVLFILNEDNFERAGLLEITVLIVYEVLYTKCILIYSGQ